MESADSAVSLAAAITRAAEWECLEAKVAEATSELASMQAPVTRERACDCVVCASRVCVACVRRVCASRGGDGCAELEACVQAQAGSPAQGAEGPRSPVQRASSSPTGSPLHF